MGEAYLKFDKVKVIFLDGSTAEAVTEGNNAAWICACGEMLLGRCYYAYGHIAHSVCPKKSCGKSYIVEKTADKTAGNVIEEKVK